MTRYYTHTLGGHTETESPWARPALGVCSAAQHDKDPQGKRGSGRTTHGVSRLEVGGFDDVDQQHALHLLFGGEVVLHGGVGHVQNRHVHGARVHQQGLDGVLHHHVPAPKQQVLHRTHSSQRG